jgi:hypothetical protein
MKLKKTLLPKPQGPSTLHSIFVIKDYTIMQIPQLPSSDDEYFKEKWKLHVCLCKP